jgi:hypothetical protein
MNRQSPVLGEPGRELLKPGFGVGENFMTELALIA